MAPIDASRFVLLVTFFYFAWALAQASHTWSVSPGDLDFHVLYRFAEYFFMAKAFMRRFGSHQLVTPYIVADAAALARCFPCRQAKFPIPILDWMCDIGSIRAM